VAVISENKIVGFRDSIMVSFDKLNQQKT